ncbi:PepSY domain-containing protein [Psychrosphaera ytuae]|nr:PepSY domain-containing protein [Psychrosphaera ytuae]
MAFTGIQFLFWSITGVYMVSMDIHYIHGESIVKQQKTALNLDDIRYTIDQLAADFPNADQISLSSLQGLPVYRFNNGESGKVMVDAVSGKVVPPIDETSAKQIANYYYNGSTDIVSVTQMSSVSDMPAELSPRHLPFWQIQYQGFLTPTLYVSQHSGEIVAKRHDLWRLFDWMWRFHIMDYDDGENVGNWLLFLFALFGVGAAVTGGVLTFHHVGVVKYRAIKGRTS